MTLYDILVRVMDKDLTTNYTLLGSVVLFQNRRYHFRHDALSRVVWTITSREGARPSVSRGRLSILSMALSTASSQALTPLDLISLRAVMLPSKAAVTSTSATGLPLIWARVASNNTIFGFSLARSRPA